MMWGSHQYVSFPDLKEGWSGNETRVSPVCLWEQDFDGVSGESASRPCHNTHPSPNIKISLSTITVNTSPLRSSDHTHNSQSGVPVQRSFLHVQYNVQAPSGHILCEDGTCFLLAVNGRTKKLHHTGTLELTSICGKGGRQRIEINRCKTEDRQRED